jgi:hypothetical protein
MAMYASAGTLSRSGPMPVGGRDRSDAADASAGPLQLHPAPLPERGDRPVMPRTMIRNRLVRQVDLFLGSSRLQQLRGHPLFLRKPSVEAADEHVGVNQRRHARRARRAASLWPLPTRPPPVRRPGRVGVRWHGRTARRDPPDPERARASPEAPLRSPRRRGSSRSALRARSHSGALAPWGLPPAACWSHLPSPYANKDSAREVSDRAHHSSR